MNRNVIVSLAILLGASGCAPVAVEGPPPPAPPPVATVAIEVGDRPYYVHGPYYVVHGRRLVWVSGHWAWRHGHRVWVHGHYVAR